MSTVNWCEEDYARSAYVAEWYNTLSSVAIISGGFLGLILYPPADRSVFHALTVVGVGSVLFHATLTAWAQMLDEIPMLLVIHDLMINICPPLQARGHLLRRFGVALSIALAVTAQCKAFFGAFEFYLFQGTFIILCGSFAVYTGLMWYRSDTRLTKAAKGNFTRGATLFLGGWVMWLTEQSCCTYIKEYNIPVQLHAVWHLLSAAGAYFLCVYSIQVKNHSDTAFLHHIKVV